MMKSATTAERDRALRYHQSRPSYSPEIVDFVIEHAGRETLAVVADIGCGTGLSTSLFRRHAGTLIGLEPDPAMRSIADVVLSSGGIQVLNGSAEVTPLPDKSVNLAVAASCFEWFDQTRAAAEFQRILTPGGKVLLMWNHRVVVNTVTHAWDRLWLRHMGPRLGPDRDDIEGFFVPGFLEAGFHRFSRVDHHRFDEDRLQQFALSSRYAPRPSQERRWHALHEAIAAFCAERGEDGSTSLAFETVAFLGAPSRRP